MNIELFITIIAALLAARVLAPLADRFSAFLFGNPQRASASVSASASGNKGGARSTGQ